MRPFSLFFIVSAIPLAGACSILSGSDDTSGATVANSDAGEATFYGDSGKRDSGSSSARDGGAKSDAGSTSGSDGGAFTVRKDGGSSGGENCAALESCCETMSSSSGCETVVGEANESTCASTLDSYQSGGYCTGGTACATLSDCCADLPAGPGWADTCNQEVGIGNDTECSSLYGTYQNDGYCNGNPGGLSDNCYALQGCCAELTGSDLASCNSYVSGNVDGTCYDALLSYQDQDLCE